MKHKILLICLLVLLCTKFMVGRAEVRTHIDVPASEELHCIYFDQQGLLWMGTSAGIRSYDGYAVREQFANVVRNYPQLGSDVRCLTTDAEGHLWAGTNNGLVCIDTNSGESRLFVFPKQSQQIIYCLFTAHDGTVYVGTDDGFSVFDKARHDFEHFNVHISHDTCTISLDSSGESLHKRGYRVGQTDAPISEVLAAGMLLLAGWDGQCNFIDPFCGSGTFLIEAALIALNIPPGLYRSSFGFEKWKDFDKDLFDVLYQDESGERAFEYKIFGYDISRKAIRIASENVKSAGLSKYIQLSVQPIDQLEAPAGKNMIVTNPPYGERLDFKELANTYETLGSVLKHRFPGTSAWIISSQESLLYKIGLKPSKKIDLLNGALECRFNGYDIFAGKRKDFLSKI
jgi:hypothetical protein